MPEGTFSARAFLLGLGGEAKRVLWDLNVFTLNASEACAQVAYIGALPGQQQAGVLLELGARCRAPPLGHTQQACGGAWAGLGPRGPCA